MGKLLKNPWRHWVLVLAVILCIACIRYITKSHIIHTLESPDGKYKVELTQERRFLLVERFVSFRAVNYELSLLEKKDIFRGDWLDGYFDEYYPVKSWIKPNILQISDGKEKTDTLRINNNGNISLRYVVIQTGRDKFFVFNFEPNSHIDLQIGYSWILTVEAETQNGQKAQKQFQVKIGRHGNHKLEVSISDQDISVMAINYELKPTLCCSVWK